MVVKGLDKAFLGVRDVLKLFFLGYLFSVIFIFGMFVLLVRPMDSYGSYFLIALVFAFVFFSLPFLASFALVDYDAKKRIKKKKKKVSIDDCGMFN